MLCLNVVYSCRVLMLCVLYRVFVLCSNSVCVMLCFNVVF